LLKEDDQSLQVRARTWPRPPPDVDRHRLRPSPVARVCRLFIPHPAQEHALRKLLTLVDAHWAEAADLVTVIEALAENEAFPARELASAVASKVSCAVLLRA
jgi:hypothetical protein